MGKIESSTLVTLLQVTKAVVFNSLSAWWTVKPRIILKWKVTLLFLQIWLMAILFTECYQEFWPVRKLCINQFCFYRPNLFFPQVLSLSVSDLKRVRSTKQWNPLIDLRPMAVEYICSENARWLLSLHNTSL